ncbi:MAG: hypothetical protein AB7H80_03800, partial [Candidatus Kapaibacterium sp.]
LTGRDNAIEDDQNLSAKKLNDQFRQQEESEVYTLNDFFTIKRGVETGDNDFFLLSPMEVLAYDLPLEFLRPILPGPHSLPDQEIVADPEGHPILDNKLFLLDCSLPEREIKEDYPSLWQYLEIGLERGVHERYSCRHRTPWYSQERRPPAPYICAYMGRESLAGEAPFRFIMNHSKAIAPNIYLMMYPRPALARQLIDNYPLRVSLWGALNAIGLDEILHRSRIYGEAYGKLEPMELASVPAERISRLIPDFIPDSVAQMQLFGGEEE